MFLTKKLWRSYIGLYHKLLYKIFIITDIYPTEHSSHNSPNVTTSVSSQRSTVLCAPQEAAPVCSGQCAFTKQPSDAAIGQYPCDTAIPSDTPWTFIQDHLLHFCDRYRGDVTLCQEFHAHMRGGAS